MYVWNLDRYKIETKKDSTELLSCVICLHFWTDNPHELLKNKNSETCLNVLESIYENEIDFSELIVEIDNRFKRLVRSSGTTFERSATAIDFL